MWFWGLWGGGREARGGVYPNCISTLTLCRGRARFAAVCEPESAGNGETGEACAGW